MKLDFRKKTMTWQNDAGSITVTHDDYKVYLTIVKNDLDPKFWEDRISDRRVYPKYYGIKHIKQELYTLIENHKRRFMFSAERAKRMQAQAC